MDIGKNIKLFILGFFILHHTPSFSGCDLIRKVSLNVKIINAAYYEMMAESMGGNAGRMSQAFNFYVDTKSAKGIILFVGNSQELPDSLKHYKSEPNWSIRLTYNSRMQNESWELFVPKGLSSESIEPVVQAWTHILGAPNKDDFIPGYTSTKK